MNQLDNHKLSKKQQMRWSLKVLVKCASAVLKLLFTESRTLAFGDRQDSFMAAPKSRGVPTYVSLPA
jgi:hypothetical protein